VYALLPPSQKPSESYCGFLSMSVQVLSILDADALLNFVSHHQCDTHNMHNRFWLIASNCSIWVGGNKSRMCTEVQGRMCPTPIPKRHLVDKKKNMIRYFLIRPHTSNHLELKKHVLFYLSRTTEVFPRKKFAAWQFVKLENYTL